MRETAEDSPETAGGGKPPSPASAADRERILLLECRLEQLRTALDEARADADRARISLADASAREADHARRSGVIQQELADARAELALLHERLGRSEALREELEGHLFESGARGDAAELVRLRREVLVQRERTLVNERALSHLRARLDALRLSRETLLTRVAEWQRLIRRDGPEAVDMAEFIAELRRDILDLEHRNAAGERTEAALRERMVRAGLDPDAPETASDHAGVGRRIPEEDPARAERGSAQPGRGPAEVVSESARLPARLPRFEEATRRAALAQEADRPEDPEKGNEDESELAEAGSPSAPATDDVAQADVPERGPVAATEAGTARAEEPPTPAAPAEEPAAPSAPADPAAAPADVAAPAAGLEAPREEPAAEPVEAAPPPPADAPADDLSSADPSTRAAAYGKLLQRLGDDPARLLEQLSAGMADPDPRVRRRAVLAAATAGRFALHPVLEPLRNDADPHVRRVVREVLRHARPLEREASRPKQGTAPPAGASPREVS